MSNPHRKARRARNKRYTPRQVRTPMLVGSELVMRPVEQLIEQIEREGTVMADGAGNAIIQGGDGDWYDAAGGIEGLIWHLEMWCTRHCKALPLQPLRDLHTALKYQHPILEKTLRELRLAMPVLRVAMAGADPDDALDILQQTRIKAELEQAGSR